MDAFRHSEYTGKYKGSSSVGKLQPTRDTIPGKSSPMSYDITPKAEEWRVRTSFAGSSLPMGDMHYGYRGSVERNLMYEKDSRLFF